MITLKDNLSIIDNFVGLCAGISTCKFVRHFMNPDYITGGSIVKAGIIIISTFSGIKMGTIIRDQSQNLRQELVFLGSAYKENIPKEENKEDI